MSDEKEPSGKLLLRLGKSLHGRAIEEAESEGVSLNTLLLTFVAEGMARLDERKAALLAK